MNIALSSDLEKALLERAQEQGLTTEAIALQILRERLAHPTPQPPGNSGAKNLKELLAGHIGVIASSEVIPGGARMSEDCGKKFASGLAANRNLGREWPCKTPGLL
jgi:hypothetical protein